MQKYLIRIAISLVILGALLTQLDFSALSSIVSVHSALFMAVSCFCVMGQIYCLNHRWHKLLNASDKEIPYKVSAMTNIMGYFANVFFITSVGGIIAKSALAIKLGLPVTYSVFVTFLDRFLTFLALVLFSVLCLPFLYGVVDIAVMQIILGLVVCCALGFLALFVGVRSARLWRAFIFSNKKRVKIVIAMRRFLRKKHLFVPVLSYSLFAQLLFFISVYVLAYDQITSIEQTLELFLLLPIISLVSALPVGFGGWGIREGAFVYGLGLIGFSVEGAFLLSVQVGIVGLIAPVLIGLKYYITGDLRAFLSDNKIGFLKKKV